MKGCGSEEREPRGRFAPRPHAESRAEELGKFKSYVPEANLNAEPHQYCLLGPDLASLGSGSGRVVQHGHTNAPGRFAGLPGSCLDPTSFQFLFQTSFADSES